MYMTCACVCVCVCVCVRACVLSVCVHTSARKSWAARSTRIREYEVNLRCSCFNFGARIRPSDWADIAASFSKISQSCFHSIFFFFSHSSTLTEKEIHIARILVEIKFGSWAPSCHCTKIILADLGKLISGNQYGIAINTRM